MSRRRIKAGEYEIEPGATPRALLDEMVSGAGVVARFTIVDGWRVRTCSRRLRRNPDVVVDVARRRRAILMAKLGAPGIDPEGEFLPETYQFPSGTTDLEMLEQAHARLVRELEAAWSGSRSAICRCAARKSC